MFRRGKRGQITVFVLLAIVILFAFMFLLFMKVFIEKNRYTVMATQQVQDYISQNSLSIYVTSCIDSVTTEAVIRASLQGGIMNFSNKTYGKDYITYFVPEYNRTVNISIAVTPNDNCSVVRNDPWEYPYPYTKLYPKDFLIALYDNHTLTCKYSGDVYDFYSGFFGRNQLLRLCNRDGTNKIGSTNTSFGIKTCESGTYSNPLVTSVQQEMERFIEQEVQKCIDFNEVLKRSPSNITQAGAPKAFITFGDNGFNVRLQYPFTVTVRGRQPITTFYDFGIEKSIRFKEVYDYTYFSIRTDVQEAGFNMLEDKIVGGDGDPIEDLGKTYRNYDIKRIKSIDGAQNDIIRMIDYGTKIDGNPLIFQFVIKNTRPALEFINEYSGFLEVDILASQNETLIISPQGYDPDDDDIEYVYGLWKEDYNEYFNYSDDKCTGQNGQIVTLDYVRVNCSIKNWSSQPNNFTNSTLFVRTGKDAEYMPGNLDMGFHVLNVSIKEIGRQNLTDWQIIKIFIFDNPRANITATNRYGFDDGIASIEDPYILNGSNSVVGLSEVIAPYNNFSSFVWNDSRGEFEKEIYISVDRNKTLYLPIDVNGTEAEAIGSIKQFVFSQPLTRNITLRVNTYRDFYDIATFEVDVRKCLPFRNNTNLAYPYNSPNTDPYFANHTCCTGAFQYAGGVCYMRVEYGANRSFINYWTRIPSPPPLPENIQYLNMPAFLRDAQNDVFNRTFTRYCDTKRGNICNGTATETRRVLYFCDDTNNNAPFPTFRDERCSGPPVNMITYSYPYPYPCVQYTAGNTFELYAHQLSLLGQPADGICTTIPQCAEPGVANPFSSTNEKYKCGGWCGGGSCSQVAPSSCSCDSTCNGGGSILCDGNSYYPPGLLRLPSGSIIHCEGGNSLYQDACGSCMLTDAIPSVCRTPGPGSLIPDPITRAGCTAPSVECDGINANSAIGSRNNEGCTIECNYINCGLFAYNTLTNNCRNTCSDDTHCSINALCCNATRLADNECSNLNQCFEPVLI